MKKMSYWLLFGVSIVCVVTDSHAEQWKVFESRQGHVLDYPPDWVAAEGDASTLYDSLTGQDAGIQIISFPLDYTDMYPCDGKVCSTVEDFVDKVVLPNLQSSFPYMRDPTVVPQREKTLLHNQDCIVLTYFLPKTEQGNLVHKFYLFIDDSLGVHMGYALCFYGNPNALTAAEKIIRSFRFSDNPEVRKSLIEEIKSGGTELP